MSINGKSINRIYYRNTFLHIGHCQTLHYNNEFAENTDGICYAIIDDRQSEIDILNMQNHIDYLKLDKIKCISVIKYLPNINKYTEKLLTQCHAYIETLSGKKLNSDLNLDDLNQQCRIKIYNNKPNISEDNNKYDRFSSYPHLQLQSKPFCEDMNTDILIGYTKFIRNKYVLVYIFDYIIKTLDIILNVTDVVKTNNNDISDENMIIFFKKYNNNKINYHDLKTYQIHGFKYSKKFPLTEDNYNDIRYLTLKGLQLRHIPSEVIKCFYKYGMQLGSIDINQLYSICKSYLKLNCVRISGIVDPLKVIIDINDNVTEYIKKPYNLSSDKEYLSPMSNILYINKCDYGSVYTSGNISILKYAKLRYSSYIYCDDIEFISENGNTNINSISVKKIEEIKQTELNPRDIRGGIPFVSSIYGTKPTIAKFIFPGWFYTGCNKIDLNITESIGYVDDFALKVDSYIYFERIGFFKYDNELSKKNKIHCFVCIISDEGINTY